MKTRWTMFLLAAALAVPAAFAQTTGRIEGRAVDKNGDPLPGVTVTAESSALQGSRTVVTEADGRFRLLAMPPGNYTIKAGLDGFNDVETRADLGLDRTVTLEVEMSPVFGDVVTISAEAPVIDVTSTTSGASFDSELIAALPTTRTYQGLAFSAPGVVGGGLGSNPSIAGASAAENRYVVDGLDTTDPAFGTIGSSLAFEFIQEVEVKTGGYEAEFGGALGGVLNVITKSGSNDFKGDVFAYYSNDSLQDEAPPTTQFGRELGFTEYDLGFDLGGKFIQDKLWYFVAVNPSFKDTDFVTRTGTNYTQEFDRTYFAGKLTWQANPSHQLVLSGFGDPSDGKNDVASRNSGGLVAHDTEFGAKSFGVTYNGTVGSNFLLEASAGRYDQSDTQKPLRDVPFYQTSQSGSQAFLLASGCVPAGTIFVANTVFNTGCVGGTFTQETGERSRDDIRASATMFATTGPIDHEFKLGTNFRKVEYLDYAHYPGGTNGRPGVDSTGYVYDPGGIAGERWGLFVNSGFARLIDYDQNSKGTTDETALFFQDQLRISDYLTLNLGVRADKFTSEGERSNLGGRSLDFSFSDTVAPRIGFVWDVTRNGRSKLYGHFGRFYESVPLDINVRAFGNEQFQFYYFYFPEDGSLPTVANPGTWFYSYLLGVGTAVDPGIEAMYSDEQSLGFEYEVATGIAVGVKGVRRELGNVIEDISVDGGHTYFITNPGGTYTSNPVTGEVLPAAIDFPEAIREYQAIELTLNKRFSNNWQAFFSYVNSKNEGNYGGLFRQDNGQLDPNITSLFDLPSLLLNADGPLPNDRKHQVKVYGSYLWPFKLVTGFNGQYLTGTPINKLGGHTIYGASERFIVPRGSAGRTDDVWSIDTHLEYPVSFGGRVELKLIADVFNITNESTATTVDNIWTNARALATTNPNECGGPGTGLGTTCPAGNPLWGKPTSYQTPRTIRLGLKASF